LLYCFPLVFLFSGCGKAPDPWPPGPGKRVMTTFPPLYCFALNVGGKDASVLCLLGSTSPHDYEPSIQDALKLQKADLFLINGLDLDETFAEKLKNNATNEKLKLVKVGESVAEKDRLKMDKKEKEHEHEGHHHHGEYDPHVWLGLPEAIVMVQCIRDRMKEADPEHAAGYDQRAGDYIAKLKELQKEGEAAFKDKQQRKLISFHDSLGYFARTFGLTVMETIQPMAGEDPDPHRLARLVELCKKEGITVIAVEPNQMSNNAAKTLLEELKKKGVPDAVIVETDVLEVAPPEMLKPEHADYYVKKMSENIKALAKALK